jgi:hypothetical protein
VSRKFAIPASMMMGSQMMMGMGAQNFRRNTSHMVVHEVILLFFFFNCFLVRGIRNALLLSLTCRTVRAHFFASLRSDCPRLGAYPNFLTRSVELRVRVRVLNFSSGIFILITRSDTVRRSPRETRVRTVKVRHRSI